MARQLLLNRRLQAKKDIMLHWSLIFLVIALIAGALGFTGLAGAAAGIAKILFIVFLIVWALIFFFVRKAVSR